MLCQLCGRIEPQGTQSLRKQTCILRRCTVYTESGLKLLGLVLTSLATQGVCAEAQPNAYTGYGIIPRHSCEDRNLVSWVLPR